MAWHGKKSFQDLLFVFDYCCVNMALMTLGNLLTHVAVGNPTCPEEHTQKCAMRFAALFTWVCGATIAQSRFDG